MAIDRRNGTEVAMETVKLAEDFMLSSDGLVVGLDLSGDPTVSQNYSFTLNISLCINRVKTLMLLRFSDNNCDSSQCGDSFFLSQCDKKYDLDIGFNSFYLLHFGMVH